MYSFKEFKLTNLIAIEFYYILILIQGSFEEEFIDIKKLSIYDSSYFVIFDNGLYLYDLNALNYVIIHEFNSDEFLDSNNIINITELYYGHKAYIFCLINKYLFILNEFTFKMFNYQINEVSNYNDNYYNIMPYKIENNNISFIIAFNEDNANLIFYYYNFNFDEAIIQPKEIKFTDMNIQNKIIRCTINSYFTFIICFYYSKDNAQNYLASTIFYINDMNLEKGNTFSLFDNLNEIKQIKLAMSYNDKFFVCFTNDEIPICLINDFSYEFKQIGCEISCGITMFSSQTRIFSIIYINDYQLVNYLCFSNFGKYNNISEFKKIKDYNYIEEIKNSIYNSQNNIELISILNKILKNNTCINYIDEKNEIIIPKDEMTIAFTSTYFQKTNDNKNATTINLGKCEEKLKKIYNISEENNLYLLKIDKEKKGKNYTLIEYEVFYPFNDGRIEILNLSFCKGINIELSIPIIINDRIDKHNPKSNYYNDICSKAKSDSNTDITLNDRRNDFIKNNMSLCEDNCELVDYDNNRAKCSCNVKSDLSLERIELDGKTLMANFFDIKKITNIEIIKCYKIVFSKNNMKNNYGIFIFIFIFILYFLCIIVFYCKSWKKLLDEIVKIIKAKNKKNHLNKNKPLVFLKNNMINSKRKNKKIENEKIDSISKIIKKRNIISMKRNKIGKIKNNGEINKKYAKREIKSILEYTDSELNSLPYKKALKNDKRTYIQYYLSLLKKKQSILFSFYPNKDYNSQIIKSFLFFFNYSSDITVNALFFTDDTMHEVYVNSGDYNLNYQLPQIIYSFLISNAINFIIEYLSLSEDSIISIKSQKNINLHKNKKIIKSMKIKFVFFFIISFLLLLIFGYYISCFCCIYENTQIHLFKDSLMSFFISLIYPIFICLIPSIFRIAALSSKKGDKCCVYKFSKIIELF